MKCPKCGSPKARYVENRRKYWHGHKGFTQPVPRTNFDAICDKCEYKWNTQEKEKSNI